jgi:hypothetical protein
VKNLLVQWLNLIGGMRSNARPLNVVMPPLWMMARQQRSPIFSQARMVDTL